MTLFHAPTLSVAPVPPRATGSTPLVTSDALCLCPASAFPSAVCCALPAAACASLAVFRASSAVAPTASSSVCVTSALILPPEMVMPSPAT